VTAQHRSRRGAGSSVLGWLLSLLLPGALAAQAGPVDTLTRQDLLRSGRTDLAEILQSLLPGFNLPRPSNRGATDLVRPLTWHGLGPDQVLVLVNGKRRPESAFLSVSETIGRGEGLTDLSAIPLSAIERIEVHRTGDAARYGPGAVAGVIDLILRARGPGEATALLGQTTAGDGTVLQAAGSHGVALGRAGWIQLAAEVRSRDATNRAGPDLRPQYFPGDQGNHNPAFTNRVDQRLGDPDSRELKGALNAQKRLGPIDAYGFGTLSRRRGEAATLWRTAGDDGTVRALYPDGFLPVIAPRINDGAGVVGLRGSVLGISWDAGMGYARNSLRYQLLGTANPSLGPPSPTRFDAGTLRADQFSLELGLSRRVRGSGLLPPLLLALGGVHRSDGYQIEAGEPDSYRNGAVPVQDGPHAGAPAPIGAQGFPGFRPTDAIIQRRKMAGTTGALSTVLFRRLTLTAEGRLEFHQVLGNLSMYQLAGRLGPLRGLSLRASQGTGIRVPSLSQYWFSSSATDVGGPSALEDRTVPVLSPIGLALGTGPLRPERSRQLDLGGTFTPTQAFTLSADYYRVRVRRRIILSGTFDDPAVLSYLGSQGFGNVGKVRFFTNALGTRTAGFDATAAYRMTVGEVALGLSAAWHHQVTHITLTDSITGLLSAFTSQLFDRVARERLTRGQPGDNLILSARAARGRWAVDARAQRFGSVTSFGAPADSSLDQTYGAKWLGDVSASYRFRGGRSTVRLGADNVLNTYPDRNRFGDAKVEGNSNFGMFPYPVISPFGFSGRFVYLRMELRPSGE